MGICAVIRILRVNDLACVISQSKLVLNVSAGVTADKFRAGNKPSLLHMNTSLAPYNRNFTIYPISIILVSFAHSKAKPISVTAVWNVCNRCRKLVKIFRLTYGRVCSISYISCFRSRIILHIISRAYILIYKPAVLSAKCRICGRWSRNDRIGLIQEFPHIYLSVLFRTETYIMNKIIHIHHDTAVLYLLEICKCTVWIRESVWNQRIQISVFAWTIIMVYSRLPVFAHSREICRVQSIRANYGRIAVIWKCWRRIYHRKIILTYFSIVPEFDPFARHKNKFLIGIVLVAKLNFIDFKVDLICISCIRL